MALSIRETVLMTRFFVVLTTIQPPSQGVKDLCELLLRYDGRLLVIGDRKGPADFRAPAARFYPLAQQQELPFSLASQLPTGHYARKNLGYLEAIRQGAPCIFETDDDNAPLPGWAPRPYRIQAETCATSGWVNVYRFFTKEFVWPRGFPLNLVRCAAPELQAAGPGDIAAPIQQGLVNESADVDAVWRLVADRPIYFEDRPAVQLAPGAWCPFNSQYAWWWPPAYPLLYLPSHCTFRMTDIWRSLVAQRCLWELGYGLLFYSPQGFQARNPHNLMRDFEDEVPGYLRNEEIARLLGGLRLTPGAENTPSNLIRCYEALVDAKIVGAGEAGLLKSWLADLVKAGWSAKAG
jgi:hypothetical protein